ncbi:MAG: tRNA (guanosine(46)-N7)-methyltransferase TrmB [Planctomycetota bacterium]
MKPKRSLARRIDRFLVPWRRCAWPLDWHDVFGRTAPLALEIGFGNGEFLAQEAREHPERDYVGLEISWESTLRLMHRIVKYELRNVRVALGDAELLTGVLFAPDTLVECTLNHPCPWPKDRHHKRRLIQAPFLSVLAERLRMDAVVTIQTDHADYARWIGEALEAQRDLVSCFETTEVASLGERMSTKYQCKATDAGVPIHYFRWRKARDPQPRPQLPYLTPPASFPTTSETMPSVTLTGPFDIEQLFEGFTSRVTRAEHEGQDVHVRLHGAWRHAERPAWLIETLTREGKLDQDFALLVQRDDAGRLLLKDSQFGHPHPTWGVRRALWEAAAYVLERHPELVLHHHNLGDAAELSSPR